MPHALRGVLARRSAGAMVVGAVGEQLPLADGTVDGVVASSSWHWMDPAIAGADVARVLRVGGVFGLLWSGPDRRVEWVADLLGRRRSQEWGDGAAQRQRQRRTMVLPAHLPFTERETTVVEFAITANVDDLAGLSGTFSVAIVGGGPEGSSAAWQLRRGLPDRGIARTGLRRPNAVEPGSPAVHPGRVAPTKSFQCPGSSRTTVPVWGASIISPAPT